MLQIDRNTGTIFYQGNKVGEHRFENGKHHVQLSIEYSTKSEVWFTPLISLSIGIRDLPENLPQQPDLIIELREDCIHEKFNVSRSLNEKVVKRNGYRWEFHKNDVDPWPSPLHGHEYDKQLILDAVTGNIFDSGTREHCKTMKSKDLNTIQETLRKSDDFNQKVADLIGTTP
jgi:hypothetical protein